MAKNGSLFEQECDRAEDLEHWDGAEEYFAARGFRPHAKFDHAGGVDMDVAAVRRAKRHLGAEDDPERPLAQWLARKRARRGGSAAKIGDRALSLRAMLGAAMARRIALAGDSGLRKPETWGVKEKKRARLRKQLETAAEAARAMDQAEMWEGYEAAREVAERIEAACSVMAANKAEYKRHMDGAFAELSRLARGKPEAVIEAAAPTVGPSTSPRISAVSPSPSKQTKMSEYFGAKKSHAAVEPPDSCAD